MAIVYTVHRRLLRGGKRRRKDRKRDRTDKEDDIGYRQRPLLTNLEM